MERPFATGHAGSHPQELVLALVILLPLHTHEDSWSRLFGSRSKHPLSHPYSDAHDYGEARRIFAFLLESCSDLLGVPEIHVHHT